MKYNFIQVQQRLYDCELLDIYHINILAWISSYQRQERDFFMSQTELAKKFKCNTRTITRRFEDLEKWELVKKNGKHKRSWKWLVNADKLHHFTEKHCRLKVNNPERNMTQSQLSEKKHDSSTRYNNINKTSNKTSLKGEASLNASPSALDIELWLKTEIDT